MKLSELSLIDKIKLAAELDGWKDIQQGHPATGKPTVGRSPDAVRRCVDYTLELPDYDISYDAIIPLIQKQTSQVRENIMSCLVTFLQDDCIEVFYNATPSQLLDALLVATGKQRHPLEQKEENK